MLRRALLGLLLAPLVWSLLQGTVVAAEDDRLPVVVIDVRNPLDQRLIDFLVETLATTPAHLFIIQVDSPGVSSGRIGPLYEAMLDAESPVVVWVGATPAVAFGGAGSMLNIADIGSAAPGASIGLLAPSVVGGPDTVPQRTDRGDPEAVALATDALRDSAITIREPVAGYVDLVEPSIGQLVVALDGAVVTKGGVDHEITTARLEATDAGEVLVPARQVQFLKPGLWDRFLRLAARPEAAFFFLVAGLAAVAFEFYAAGVGITAAVGAVSLFLAGYGMATLPMSWPAVAATLGGLLLYTWDFQRARLGWRSVLGTVLLLLGGLRFTDARPQFSPVWWIVVAVVIGVALFYTVALTTIVRSRFSTSTIGRQGLIGRRGIAETGFDPTGVVVVDGARWRGRSHREAAIGAGDSVEILAVSGVVLEIGPIQGDSSE